MPHQSFFKHDMPSRVTPKPRQQVKRRRPKTGSLKAVRQAIDRLESAKVPERSEGRCEVLEVILGVTFRCMRAATQIHHQIGGRGKRGIGISALAQHKQHVCDQCHLDITGDVGGKKLKRIGGVVPLWNDRYQRVK